MSSPARTVVVALVLCASIGAVLVLRGPRAREAEPPVPESNASAVPAAADTEGATADLEPALRAAVESASAADLTFATGSAADGEGEALVLLRVVTRPDGEPVRDTTIWVREEGGERKPTTRGTWSPGSDLGLDQVGKTDARGTCRARVRSGRRHEAVLYYEGRELAFPLPALVRRARYEHEIAIRLDLDSAFHGVVIDAVSGKPVEGADVGGETRTDARGAFRVACSSWRDRCLSITKASYAPAMVFAQPGCETPERACPVRLFPGAHLELRAITPDGAPVPDVEVTVTASAPDIGQQERRFDRVYLPDPTWSGVSDARGMLALAGLPSYAPLDVVAVHAERARPPLAETPVLESGETRRVDLVIGNGARIVGFVVDRDGEPIERAGVRISAWDEDRKQDELLPHPRTDDAGRFEVEGVGAGLWHFEVQPRNPPEEGPARALAPIEALVRVPVDERDSQVVLVLDRGLYIEGRAIDEQGRSAREATVTATAPFGFPRMRVPPTWDAETFREQREEPELRWLEVREVFLPMEIDQVDAAGRFSIGPLPSGTYEVGVLQWLLNEGVAPVRANAGETDLELHLEKKTP